jgi:hypothetical protein
VRFHRGSSAFALGRLKPGAMNKGEAAYASYLEMRKHAGEVLWWRFEGLKLRLADNTFYTPDFAVMASDGVMECHEIKGVWQDTGRAKIKIASDLYPFRFRAFKAKAKKHGGGWEEEDFSRVESYADVRLPTE